MTTLLPESRSDRQVTLVINDARRDIPSTLVASTEGSLTRYLFRSVSPLSVRQILNLSEPSL